MGRTDPPLPFGFGIEFDPAAREIRRGVWLGGRPTRVLRLSPAGADALDALRAGPVSTCTQGLLARRLTDAGLADPVPAPLAEPVEITVIVPVRDRPHELERCLSALGSRHPVLVVDDASSDELRVRSIAARHGATVVRHPVNRGPAAARNTGLAHSSSELVAFLDSDTVPRGDWIGELAAHFADPLVAAVAPRVVPLRADTGAGRYTRAHGSLDLGPRPARVRPYTQVAYVPSAALLARRCALQAVARGADVFDPRLRVGEDVDLVWRLDAAGERVRFDPTVTVSHDEPQEWNRLLRRRFRYGTSAAPLARRHRRNLAPLLVHPWYTGAVGALLTGRPLLAATAAGAATARTGQALRRAGIPAAHVPPIAASALGRTFSGIGRYAVQFAVPLVVAVLARGPRAHRAAAAALLIAPAAAGWRHRRGDIDPFTFAVGAVADDIAYGAGVIAGCLRHRTTIPLRPALARQRTH